MRNFSLLIKPASSLCNLNCKYCFYHDVVSHRDTQSFGIMKIDTAHKIIDRVFDYCKETTNITFGFQGGEPLLAGLEFFEDFVSYVESKNIKSHSINYAIQTNGTLINDKWCSFFKKNNFLLGVSLDGYKQIHDKYRISNNNENTHSMIEDNIELLKKYNVDFNILTVLTSELSKHPQELFDYYKKKNYKYIQFIPCLPELNDTNPYCLKPKEFYDFYNVFFQIWLKELMNGNYISVSYFDNLISLFTGNMPRQCGSLGKCALQFVIESNGNVYPCDFYAYDDYLLGNIKDISIADLIASIKASEFLNQERKISNRCKECKFFKMCYGQCRRLSYSFYDENYCALEKFMMRNLDNIQRTIYLYKNIN